MIAVSAPEYYNTRYEETTWFVNSDAKAMAAKREPSALQLLLVAPAAERAAIVQRNAPGSRTFLG